MHSRCLQEHCLSHGNAFRWNKYLAKFVNSLCKHLNKRLATEAASQSHMSNGTRGGAVNSTGGGAVNGTGGGAVNGIAHSGRQHASTQTQRRVAQVILRMADKAQYSKVG